MRSPPGRGQDRGSGTVLAAGLVAALACLLVAASAVVAVLVAGQQARAAADQVALAAVGRVLNGEGPVTACQVAGQVAARNGVDLVDCTVLPDPSGTDDPMTSRVLVEVTRSVPGTRWRATARSAAAGVLP